MTVTPDLVDLLRECCASSPKGVQFVTVAEVRDDPLFDFILMFRQKTEHGYNYFIGPLIAHMARKEWIRNVHGIIAQAMMPEGDPFDV